jgi:hypothetical protein
MHQICNQYMICGVLRNKLKLLDMKGTRAKKSQHLFVTHEDAPCLLQHMGVEWRWKSLQTTSLLNRHGFVGGHFLFSRA